MVELFLEAVENWRVGGHWVEDLGDVAVVVEMAGADEAVASCCTCQDGFAWRFLVWSLPLFPGPHAIRTFFPFDGGWTLYTD